MESVQNTIKKIPAAYSEDLCPGIEQKSRVIKKKKNAKKPKNIVSRHVRLGLYEDYQNYENYEIPHPPEYDQSIQSPYITQISDYNLSALNAHLESSKVQVPDKKVPDGAEILNPVMLLHQMRPNLVYTKVSNNSMFYLSTNIDNQIFHGEGTSIKKAKQNLAKAALKKIFNIESVYEQNSTE